MPSPITISSLDTLHTHVPPSAPAHYLRYMIISTLRRKGFDAAEAGAIAELERLLEQHVQHIFHTAATYAELASRSEPTAADALLAQDDALEAKRLKRDSKKRRAAIRLPVIPASPSPPPQTTLDLLLDFTSDPLEHPANAQDWRQGDRKPTLEDLQRLPGPGGSGIAVSAAQAKMGRTGDVPAYAYDGAPGVPPKWTLAMQEVGEPQPDPIPQVTSGSMDFVKSTTVVGENIPPELGIVHFMKTGGKRKRLAGAPGQDTGGVGLPGR